jgi:peptide chain release factor 1
MIDKLEIIKERCHEIETELSKPEVVSDQNAFRKLNQEHSQILPIVHEFEKYKKLKQELLDAENLLEDENDSDMREMLKEEHEQLKASLAELKEKLIIMLLPKDPNSGKNIIIEIRAGTGGDEAALFGSDLFRMYSRYADIRKWKLEVIEINQNEIGGFKEAVFSLSGDNVYDDMKYESGGHRVQRIPTTEAGGRIHTSAVTVAVMPEAEENEVEIKQEDIRVDVYRASGHGGQSVNTTDSAVRITHIPTGIIVTCQDEKSQLKNKTKAMRVLRARIFEIADRERREEEAKLRKSQVGSGDRSQRIRTYNFPQGRITDHRINLTLYSLEAVLNGELQSIIDPLKKNEIEELLKANQ